jgi:hypothetical protein
VTLGDYARRLGELVDVLAETEGRPHAEIVDDLSLPPGDVISFRVQSDSAASGTLPLVVSARLRDAQKNLLLAAAHAVVAPQKYFPRMTRAEPLALLEEIRDGQTGRGSYINTVFVPVEPTVGRLPLEEPYGRRVTTLLMEMLAIVSNRLDQADDEGLVDEAPPGLSYNLLASLAKMRPPGERSLLDIRMRWSRSRPLPQAPSQVVFREPQFATIGAVAKALRERAPTTCTLEGYVTRLSRSGGDTAAPGEVVVLTELGEGDQDARVHVELSAHDYLTHAIPAHREGRRIRVAGVLRRENRRWRLVEPSGFEMLPAESEELSG